MSFTSATSVKKLFCSDRLACEIYIEMCWPYIYSVHYLSDFNQTRMCSQIVLNCSISNFIEMPSVVFKLFHAYRWRDTVNLNRNSEWLQICY
jgi:hypothetical protein